MTIRCTIYGGDGPSYSYADEVVFAPPALKVGDSVRTVCHPEGHGHIAHVFGDGYAVQLESHPPMFYHAHAVRPEPDECERGTAFARHEVESARMFGAAMYAIHAADLEQVRILARAAWVRSLPLHQEGETIGDFAARAGILPPKPGKRTQWADGVFEAMCARIAMEYDDAV